MNSRVLIYDIETAPAMGLFFGKPYDVNIAKIVQHEYVFGFAYKWLGEKRIYKCYIWDFPRYTKDKTNSIEVVRHWANLVASADVLVGHNSDSFDYKEMFGRLPMYDLPPVPKPQLIDTKKAAKQIGHYPSNKLDDLGDRMGLGRKLPHNFYPNKIDLWWDCMNDKSRAKKHMVEYNKRDVELTEQLYLKFRPYMTNHPNMANIEGRPEICPQCSSAKGFWAQGLRHTKTASYRRWQCMNCKSYVHNRKAEKVEKPSYV